MVDHIEFFRTINCKMHFIAPNTFKSKSIELDWCAMRLRCVEPGEQEQWDQIFGKHLSKTTMQT